MWSDNAVLDLPWAILLPISSVSLYSENDKRRGETFHAEEGAGMKDGCNACLKRVDSRGWRSEVGGNGSEIPLLKVIQESGHPSLP